MRGLMYGEEGGKREEEERENRRKFMDDHYIYLSYSEENYPYIYLNDGRFEGFLVEIWRLTARLLKRDISISKYHYPSLSREKEQIYDGSLGAILNGSIFSAADGGYLLTSGPHRLVSFTPSVPVLYTGASFVEPTRQDSIESTRLTFFTVFSLETVVVLIFCHLFFLSIGVATQYLRDKRLSRNVPPHLRIWARFNCLLFEFTQVVYVLALALIVYFHAAGFQGNNAIIEPPKATTFADAVKELHAGKRILLSATEDTYSKEEYEFLLGPNYPSDRVNVTDGLINYLKVLCDPPQGKKLLGIFYEGDRTAIAKIGMNCLYNQIPYTPVDGQQSVTLKGMTTMNPYFYLFARNATGRRKVMETVNQVVLKLFNRDQITDIWTTRYMSSVRSLQYTIEEKKTFTYEPISLGRLEVTFVVIIPCAAVSISSIFVELALQTQGMISITTRVSTFLKRIVSRK